MQPVLEQVKTQPLAKIGGGLTIEMRVWDIVSVHIPRGVDLMIASNFLEHLRQATDE